MGACLLKYSNFLVAFRCKCRKMEKKLAKCPRLQEKDRLSRSAAEKPSKKSVFAECSQTAIDYQGKLLYLISYRIRALVAKSSSKKDFEMTQKNQNFSVFKVFPKNYLSIIIDNETKSQYFKNGSVLLELNKNHVSSGSR